MNKIIKTLLFCTLGLAFVVPLGAFGTTQRVSSTLRGDVNSDGIVDIDDLNIIINIMVKKASVSDWPVADVTRDGVVDIDDLNKVINIMIHKENSDDEPENGTYNVNGVTFKMISVEGGTFSMGYDDSNEASPEHQATVSGFSIGETEVTQALWQAVMGTNPSHFNGVRRTNYGNYDYGTDLQRPVENVSWNDCQEFIARLNALHVSKRTFRLATEAEWEYAARGGKKSDGNIFAGGSENYNDVCWNWNNSNKMTHSVATKLPNELGIYDMSGNVAEFCIDWFEEYTDEHQFNPTGPATGRWKVTRGGSWNSEMIQACLVWERSEWDALEPYQLGDDYGLRLAFSGTLSGDLKLSSTKEELAAGGSAIVAITNGSGQYSVTTEHNSVAVAIMDGELQNQVLIKAANEGTTLVTVTDTESGQTATVSVHVVVNSAPTRTFTVNGVAFDMVGVEGGTFMMGAIDNAADAIHLVRVSDFSIGATEVTQELWKAVMGSNPSAFISDLKNPVNSVTWEKCKEFVDKLNQLTDGNFRLPTEAEWEFAARGGNLSKGYKYAGSNNIANVAWYEGNASSAPHAVATQVPNELGLYDMSGNVFEWCQDIYNDYSEFNSYTDYERIMDEYGTGIWDNPIGGKFRQYTFLPVIRGGGWVSDASNCNVLYRSKLNGQNKWTGLRLAYSGIHTDNFSLPVTSLKLGKGGSTSVAIPRSGSFTVDVNNASVAIATLQGGRINVAAGNAAGTTIIEVTENATQQKATIEVTVTDEPTPIIRTYTINTVSFSMVEVEGGTFTMGATSDQGSRTDDDEKPTHDVTLSTFNIGQTEVSQALWQAVMGTNPSELIRFSFQRPVETISWNDCQKFIARLNALTGEQFRLPTEAEWEFAARGGNLSQGYMYAGGNSIDELAWYYDNAARRRISDIDYATHKVGLKAPNELGLYDMAGNVIELCSDWYGTYSGEAVTNPKGPSTGSEHAARGGGWKNDKLYCRNASRNHAEPDEVDNSLGLRLAQ